VIQEERKLSARRMTPLWETLSSKKTYGAVTAQSKEALRQPQKNRQCKRPSQEVTVNIDMTEA